MGQLASLKWWATSIHQISTMEVKILYSGKNCTWSIRCLGAMCGTVSGAKSLVRGPSWRGMLSCRGPMMCTCSMHVDLISFCKEHLSELRSQSMTQHRIQLGTMCSKASKLFTTSLWQSRLELKGIWSNKLLKLRSQKFHQLATILPSGWRLRRTLTKELGKCPWWWTFTLKDSACIMLREWFAKRPPNASSFDRYPSILLNKHCIH